MEINKKMILCPCGSSLSFSQCCQAIILDEKKAESPEQLMRSRYSAYAVKNAQYLFDTYAKQSQKDQSVSEILQWAEQCQWLNLTIIDTSTFNVDDLASATVTFCATYLSDNTFYQLTEKSRFVYEALKWKYLDGDITSHQALKKLKRNDKCPCKSNKKFKLCCLSKLKL